MDVCVESKMFYKTNIILHQITLSSEHLSLVQRLTIKQIIDPFQITFFLAVNTAR